MSGFRYVSNTEDSKWVLSCDKNSCLVDIIVFKDCEIVARGKNVENLNLWLQKKTVVPDEVRNDFVVDAL